MTRIGSLCTGYGGLDMAVIEVLGASVAWHCQYEPPDKNGREDKHQYAARILEHHWPDIPNHGDLTKVDWTTVEPVDILTAGFPCTDISYAGLGAGIKEGTRSGLWLTIAGAIRALRPRLVVLENVRAITNRRPGLDVVLADLARLRLHAEWLCLPASGIGAPHERYRWFCLAWPADAAGPRLKGAWSRGRPAERDRVAADTDRFGKERDWAAEQHEERHAPSSDRDAANTLGDGWDEGRPEPAGIIGGPDAALGGPPALADPDSNAIRQQPVAEPRRSDQAIPQLRGEAATDTCGNGRERSEERHLGQETGLKAPRRDDAERRLLEWRQYGPAVARWEHILGRPAPRPTDDRGRLAAPFVEWMMGLPLGHVAEVPAPGMTPAGLRNARLKALGNGVVPQQAAHALRILLDRMDQPAPVLEPIGATA